MSDLVLREYQNNAIELLRQGFAAGHRSQLLYLGTGGGKTEIAIAMLEAAKKKGSKAAMILDRVILCDQTSQRLEKYDIDHGVLQSGHWRYRPYEHIQVCSAQTLEKRGSFPGLNLLIVDECFPGETLVDTPNGRERIDKIKDGGLIYNATGVGVVRSVFSKTVFRAVLVRLSNGKSIECTEDHPIFTDVGWRPAGSLARGEKLFCRQAVRALWQGCEATSDSLKEGGSHSGGGVDIQKSQVLRELLRQEVEQPHAQAGVASKNDGNTQEDWPQAYGSRGERYGHDSGGKDDAWKAALGMGVKSHGENLKEACSGVSASLQAGLGDSFGDALSGVGWRKSRITESTGAGQKEGCTAASTWVESVQNVEYPSGKVVFNLRVSGHPSYFADGFLVHNCHAKRRQTLEFIKNNPHIKVVGLSASPFTKGLGETYTSVVSPITTRQLVDQGSLVPLRVFIAKEIDMTGAKKVAGEWSEKEATKRGMQITGDVVAEWIKKTHEIFGKPEKTVVFCSGVEHGADLAKKFSEQGYNFVSISYKDDEEFKRDVIEDFAKPDTDITGLIACDVLTKGFDNPSVKIAVSARPFSKSFASHVQQMGRVMRTYPGKEFGVWLDHAGNYIRFQEDWDEVFENGVHELDDAREKAKKEKTDKEKEAAKCPKCGHLWAGGSDTCLHCGYTREKRSMVESVPGEMEELKQAASRESKQDWYSMCQFMVKYHGWSPGRAAHTYKDKFGVWPKALAETTKTPTVEFDKAVKAALIRYLKGKK